jgi:cysteine desulfurase
VREAAARFDVTLVGVDHLGRVDPDEVVAAIRPRETALVHLQWGNHEVATLQPVAEVVAACRERGVLVHVDAAAAAGHVPIDFDNLGVDLLSVSAHKFGGPQGVGALLVRRGLRLRPLLVGGEQERSRRAGTENVAGIVGFGTAAAAVDVAGEAARAAALTARALAAATALDGVVAYGAGTPFGHGAGTPFGHGAGTPFGHGAGTPFGHGAGHRLPHIVCLGVEGVEAEAVLLGLDQAGVAVHSGSACSSESLEPSPVLEAMGVEAERSLRVSVGWSTTEADVDAFGTALPDVVDRLRSLAGRGRRPG